MNYNRLLKEIYETDELDYEFRNASGSLFVTNLCPGRCEEYEDAIEIVFENDTVLHIIKNQVKHIEYVNESIRIEFLEGVMVITKIKA